MRRWSALDHRRRTKEPTAGDSVRLIHAASLPAAGCVEKLRVGLAPHDAIEMAENVPARSRFVLEVA